jgi:hypothetical protein
MRFCFMPCVLGCVDIGQCVYAQYIFIYLVCKPCACQGVCEQHELQHYQDFPAKFVCPHREEVTQLSTGYRS